MYTKTWRTAEQVWPDKTEYKICCQNCCLHFHQKIYTNFCNGGVYNFIYVIVNQESSTRRLLQGCTVSSINFITWISSIYFDKTYQNSLTHYTGVFVKSQCTLTPEKRSLCTCFVMLSVAKICTRSLSYVRNKGWHCYRPLKLQHFEYRFRFFVYSAILILNYDWIKFLNWNTDLYYSVQVSKLFMKKGNIDCWSFDLKSNPFEAFKVHNVKSKTCLNIL